MGQDEKDKAIDAAVNAILGANQATEFIETMSAMRQGFVDKGWSAFHAEVMTIELFKQSAALMVKGES
jgi:hypothetical protein